jgi:ABC-type nitrate/sulfonate/bicarbonate transport system permease component
MSVIVTEAGARTKSTAAQNLSGAVKVIGVRLGVVVAALAVVELLARADLLPPTFIAKPTEVMTRLWALIVGGPFLPALWGTTKTVLLAVVIAALAGTAVGYLLWRSRLLSEALVPGVAALFSSPIILLYPIPLVIFGRTATAVIVLSVVYGFLPIILYTVRSFNEIPTVLLRVSEVYCLSRWQQFALVVLPAAAPKMFTGLRMGTTMVLITVISMEFLAQLSGLGQQIQMSALRFDTAAVYAYISGVVLLVVLVISVLQLIERRLQR